MSAKAIETVYNGYRFRSRLEARWAVFFDQAGIKYQYENEGYVLSNGAWYLPDFWLPDVGVYVEVKGSGLQQDLENIVLAAQELPRTVRSRIHKWHEGIVLLLGDIPLVTQHTSVSHVVITEQGEWSDCEFSSNGRWDDGRAYSNSPGLVPLALSGGIPTGHALVDLSGRDQPPTFKSSTGSSEYSAAYGAARQSRFEHGESGKPNTQQIPHYKNKASQLAREYKLSRQTLQHATKVARRIDYDEEIEQYVSEQMLAREKRKARYSDKQIEKWSSEGISKEIYGTAYKAEVFSFCMALYKKYGTDQANRMLVETLVLRFNHEKVEPSIELGQLFEILNTTHQNVASGYYFD